MSAFVYVQYFSKNKISKHSIEMYSTADGQSQVLCMQYNCQVRVEY